MFSKNKLLSRKILNTPESDEMMVRLRKINNNIREARAYNLQEWVNGILLSEPYTLKNIYSHIHAILVAFIKNIIYVNSEEYFFLMKCGNAILNTGYINNPNKSKYIQYKYMIGLYFLNHIKKLTTYDFRNQYVCNINEYIRTCYNNILMDNSQQDNTINEMRYIYMNLKKIVHVKKYPYSIDSKIFSIMLEYWQHNNYNITEIPASYIIKDAVLTDTELAMLNVTQHEMDTLFGAYSSKDIIIKFNDESDATDTAVTVESCDQPINTAQNDADESPDEAEEGVYPDEDE